MGRCEVTCGELAAVKRAGERCHVNVVDDGNIRPALVKKIEREVVFTGFLPDRTSLDSFVVKTLTLIRYYNSDCYFFCIKKSITNLN
ncbi:hypothetical protein ASG33_10160 [Dyadobacter sp. Leaf189]|nr:hypothetical protein ASG33_10160 [Dyadobacter sp. Leaf189]